jgi:hypothetical protein
MLYVPAFPLYGSEHPLPLTMYRQIEKMSIHSLTIRQGVHKYNGDGLEKGADLSA